MTALKPYSCLAPLASIYGALTNFRESAYQSGWLGVYQANIPVICVGNIIAGGSGKTSFGAYLAKGLLARGYQPVILSRGYKGKYESPHQVTAADTVYDVGDEALMNFSTLPHQIAIVVAKDRVAGAQFIEQQKLGNVIILDDGYQHFALARDLNLLMVDLSSQRAIDNWRQERLLPAGYFRENKKRGMKRASAILLFNKNDVRQIGSPDEYLGKLDKPVFEIGYGPAQLEDLFNGEIKSPAILAGSEISLACALADPQSFEDSLAGFGARVVNCCIFPDHHYYSPEDWTRISARFPVIVTAKDAVKLKNYVDRQSICYKLIREVAFKDSSNEVDFWQMLTSRIDEKKCF